MRALARLAAAFPNPEIHPATIAVYAEALSDEKPEHIEWAVSRAIKTCKHLPRIAELLDFIKAKKIEENIAKSVEHQRRVLAEPVNVDRPKLMDLLNQQRASGGAPRRLL